MLNSIREFLYRSRGDVVELLVLATGIATLCTLLSFLAGMFVGLLDRLIGQ